MKIIIAILSAVAIINAVIDPGDVLNGCVAVAWLPLPEPYTPAEEEGNT